MSSRADCLMLITPPLSICMLYAIYGVCAVQTKWHMSQWQVSYTR